jgi:hypothetical protein
MEGILILGGGPDQLPAIHAVNRLGWLSVVVDVNEDCVGAPFADFFINVSSRDVKKIVFEVLKFEGLQIRMVFVIGTDIPYVGARVAHELGAFFPISLELAELSVDKFALKNFLRQNGFSSPFVEKLEGKSSNDFKFPCIVKPNMLAGSRGVQFIEFQYEFDKVVGEIASSYPESEILVEEFIDGIQISSEHIVSCGEVFTHGLALRNYSDTIELLPSIIENGGVQCHPVALSYLDLIEDEVKRLVNILKIESTVLKFDLIVKNQKIYILEMAVRMSGGGFASAIIPYSLGFDYIKNAIGTLLNQEDSKDILSRFSLKRNLKYVYVANRYLIPAKMFKFKDIDWFEDSYIERVLYINSGDVCIRPRHHGERSGVFVLKDESIDNLNSRINEIYSRTKVNGSVLSEFFCCSEINNDQTF